MSVSTICRLLHRHGLSRKKVQRIALERNLEYRSDFMAEILPYPREQLVWIDEMGSDRRDAMRQYGYAVLGETPRCKRIQVRGQRISAIAAISSAGMVSLELEYGILIPFMTLFEEALYRTCILMMELPLNLLP